MIDGSFINSGAGFKLKFVDFDYSGFTGDVNNALLKMNGTFNQAGVTLSEGGYVVIPTTNPVALQSCVVTGLKHYLFFDNSQKYAIGTFLIKDCIIGQNSAFNQARIRLAQAMIKDLTITNSTIYNEIAPSPNNDRFIQISTGHAGNVKPYNETWANASMTITNCTFWQVGKESQSFNSNGAMGQTGDRVTVQKCVFVDCFENGRIISRFRRGNTTATYSGGENTQWYNGQLFTGSQDLTADVGYIDTDPQLTYLGNGVFKMTGARQINARTGDPRWLPAQ